MAKQRSPKRAQAKELWLASGGKHTSKEIAEILGITDSTVRKWKSQDKWNDELKKQNKKKRGGQPGNKNAVGSGAPVGNKNAYKHGVYSKIYYGECSKEEQDLLNGITADPYENLFRQYQSFLIKEKRIRDYITELDSSSSDENLHVDTVTEMIKPNKGNINNEIDIETQYTIEDKDITVVTERGKDERLDVKIVRKSTSHERKLKYEKLLLQVQNQITKVLNSMKTYELEMQRIENEHNRYDLALKKAKGEIDIDVELDIDVEEY